MSPKDRIPRLGTGSIVAPDGRPLTNFQWWLNSAFGKIEKSFSDLGTQLGLIQAAQAKAQTAETKAEAAKSTADDAAAEAAQNTAELAEIGSDNILARNEKRRVIREFGDVLDAQPDDDAKASLYEITTEKTNYDNAILALTDYLVTLTSPVPWNDSTGNTNIDGAVWNAKWSAVYQTRVILLNKIAEKAKALSKAFRLTASHTVVRYDKNDAIAVGDQINFTVAGQNIPADRTGILIDVYRADGTHLNAADYVGVGGTGGSAGQGPTGKSISTDYTNSFWINAYSYFNASRGSTNGIYVRVSSPYADMVGVEDRWSVTKLKDGETGAGSFTLLPHASGVVSSPNSATRLDNGAAWGQASVYSKEGHRGGALARFSLHTPEGSGYETMAGLNGNPTDDASYPSLDFAIYAFNNGFYVYESGAQAGGQYGTFVPTDIFEVRYDEGTGTVYYSKNGGKPFREKFVGWLNFPLHFDSAIRYSGPGRITNISFQPLGKSAESPGTWTPLIVTAPGYEDYIQRIGSTILKPHSSDGNAAVVSKEKVTNARVSCRAREVGPWYKGFGLVSSANHTTLTGINQISYGLVLHPGGYIIGAYNGDWVWNPGAGAPFTALDDLAVVQRGSTVFIEKNGTPIYEFAQRSAEPMAAMWSFSWEPQGFTNIAFGQSTEIASYQDLRFARSASQPATPSGPDPAGWSNSHVGTGTLWVSQVTRRRSDNAILGTWSTPTRLSDLVSRGPYSPTTTYYALDLVTYNGGSYYATTTTLGNAPSGTGQSNTQWDVHAAPGATGAPATPPSNSTITVNIPATNGTVNLRSLADANGYSPYSTSATLVFNCSATIRAAPGGRAIDSGTWPSGQARSITLNANSGAVIDGGGGAGGAGGGAPGQPGGDAIFCQTSMTVVLNPGAYIRGGGNGGAGSSGEVVTPPRTPQSPEDPYNGGNGGGGGFPNGPGGAGEIGYNGGSNGVQGNPGTISGGGSPNGGGPGGGKAINKNGHAVAFSNNGGTVQGAVS